MNHARAHCLLCRETLQFKAENQKYLHINEMCKHRLFRKDFRGNVDSAT